MTYTNHELAQMHMNHYMDVQEALKNETNPARRVFLEHELERHQESYVYWSGHDVNTMKQAGFDAVVNQDNSIEYRL